MSAIAKRAAEEIGKMVAGVVAETIKGKMDRSYFVTLKSTDKTAAIIDAEFDAKKLAEWLVEHRLLQMRDRVLGREAKEVAIVTLTAAIKQWMED